MNRKLVGIAVERIFALVGFGCVGFLIVSGYGFAWQIYTSPWGHMTVNVPLTPMVLPAIAIFAGKSAIGGICTMYIYMKSEQDWKEWKCQHEA